MKTMSYLNSSVRRQMARQKKNTIERKPTCCTDLL